MGSLIEGSVMEQLESALGNVKTIVGLMGTLVALIVFVLGVSSSATSAVDKNKDQDLDIEKLQAKDHEHEKKLLSMSKDLEHIIKGNDEIKKLISEMRNEH